MRANEGTLLALTGGLRLKTRVQHPKVIERTDRGGAYWYFRYWHDEIQPDGSVKTVRKFQRIGPSLGENKLTKRQAELERDKFMAGLNKATVEEKIVEEGLILFGAMAEKYIHSYVDATAAGRSLLSISTRIKYHNQLSNHILPRWKDVRLCDIRPDEVQRWLFETCTSWHAMNDLRGIMSAVFTKAQEWGYWPENRRNPISRVKIGEKWSVNPERILTWDETARVLARIKEPNRLVVETAIATLMATEYCTEITLAAQKVMGAYGYASEFPMERYVRDSLALPIFGGSSAIQRNNIVNWLGLPK